jgi:hypothetical protein
LRLSYILHLNGQRLPHTAEVNRLCVGDVSGGVISTGAENLSSFMEQELSNGGVFCETDGPAIGVLGLRSFPELLQEVSADRPVRLIS